MKTIYVTHSVMQMEKFCLVVADEEDLQRQLAEREAAVKSKKFEAKIERNKSGKPNFYEMSSDWDGFNPQPWVP